MRFFFYIFNLTLMYIVLHFIYIKFRFYGMLLLQTTYAKYVYRTLTPLPITSQYKSGYYLFYVFILYLGRRSVDV